MQLSADWRHRDRWWPVRLLSSLLPAIIPSWRFFDRIGPAPTVEWSVADAPWQPASPSPGPVTLVASVARLFWNPARNEALFLISCAERLLDEPTPARADLLWTRVADLVRQAQLGDFHRGAAGRVDATGSMRIRIVEVTRHGEGLRREVRYVSESRPL